MAKTVKVVPITNIEYLGKKYQKGCDPFDMENETAQSLMKKGIVKQADPIKGIVKQADPIKGVDNGRY